MVYDDGHGDHAMATKAEKTYYCYNVSVIIQAVPRADGVPVGSGYDDGGPII